MNIIWRRSNISQNIFRALSNHTRLQPLSTCCDHSKNIIENCSITKLRPLNISYNITRHKSKKRSADADSDDEAEAYDDGDLSLTKDSKVIKFNTTSLRTDAILKSALGIARNKIEKLFYESKIRVNGKKILKKSLPVRIDYEIDVIKSVSPKNPDHLYIARVEIINVAAKEESIYITARRFKTLLIENYDEDPYKGSTSNDDQ